jgi:hypothetical protein
LAGERGTDGESQWVCGNATKQIDQRVCAFRAGELQLGVGRVVHYKDITGHQVGVVVTQGPDLDGEGPWAEPIVVVEELDELASGLPKPAVSGDLGPEATLTKLADPGILQRRQIVNCSVLASVIDHDHLDIGRLIPFEARSNRLTQHSQPVEGWDDDRDGRRNGSRGGFTHVRSYRRL